MATRKSFLFFRFGRDCPSRNLVRGPSGWSRSLTGEAQALAALISCTQGEVSVVSDSNVALKWMRQHAPHPFFDVASEGSPQCQMGRDPQFGQGFRARFRTDAGWMLFLNDAAEDLAKQRAWRAHQPNFKSALRQAEHLASTIPEVIIPRCTDTPRFSVQLEPIIGGGGVRI